MDFTSSINASIILGVCAIVSVFIALIYTWRVLEFVNQLADTVAVNTSQYSNNRLKDLKARVLLTESVILLNKEVAEMRKIERIRHKLVRARLFLAENGIKYAHSRLNNKPEVNIKPLKNLKRGKSNVAIKRT